MSTKVVITGLGCVSPLGNDVASTWENLVAGRSGVGRVTRFDASGFKCQLAAEVKDFDAEQLFGRKAARRMDRVSQYAMAAAGQALAQSGLVITDQNRVRVGALVGSGIGGMGTLIDGLQILAERGPERVSPFTVPMMLPDTPAALMAIEYGFQGPNMAVVTACATGNNALGEAAAFIQAGRADVMLAGGTEAAILPIAMAGMIAAGALSTRNAEPQRASRPFDADRDGFVMGEGAAILVLESEAHARQRGAHILAELSGYGTTNDAYHISAPSEDGAGAARCMQLALQSAGLDRSAIGYINAHGTSTLLNDQSETAAIKRAFGEQAYRIPVSSTKSMTGHLMGAAGALEAVIAVQALQTGILPPTINYETPDPDCDLDYVPNQARQQMVDHIMSNSFGFGGHNATLIFSRWAGAA